VQKLAVEIYKEKKLVSNNFLEELNQRAKKVQEKPVGGSFQENAKISIMVSQYLE